MQTLPCSLSFLPSCDNLSIRFLVCFSDPYPSLDLYKKIDNFIGPQLTTLANVIGEQSAKKQQTYVQHIKFAFIF